MRLEPRRATDDHELSPATLSDELRAVLAQTEDRVDLLRGTAAELKAVLPTRIEAAVSRALASNPGVPATRRLAELGETCERIAGAVDAMGQDLLAERLGRAEDLEVTVDLVSAATAAVRADVQSVERQLADLSAIVAGLAVTVRSLTPALATVSAKLDRPLAVTVEARPAAEGAPVVPPPAGGFFPTDPEPF